MRRLALVAAALVLPAVPMIAAAPAFAVDNVICVNIVDTSCTPGQAAASIQAAISAATNSVANDTILVGPGTYTDGPYALSGVVSAVTLKGSGQGSTFLTLPAASSTVTYVNAAHATVRDLTITLASNATVDTVTGVQLSNGAVAERVTVDGAGTFNDRGLNAAGSLVKSSAVLMPLSDPNSRAIYGTDANNTVTDTLIEGASGFVHSGAAFTDTLSRVTVRTSYSGVRLDSGTVNIDDSVVDLGASSGTGLLAANPNNGVNPMTINADHLTIVGGIAGSKGVVASATSANAKQTATIALADSIVRGPATSLVAEASNTLAASPANVSTATLTVSHSDYKNATSTIGANGAGGVVAGAGNLNDVDPLFVNAAGGDYHLTAASPLVDKGNPAAGGPATDRDGLARATDGDGNGTAVRDMGAYERPAVAVVPPAPPVDKTAPDTTITKQPKKKSTAAKAKLSFTSEAGATFQCQLDGGAWKACTSPYKVKVKVGKHTVLVRAIDKAGNVDATPAKAKFKRVKKPS